MVPFSVREAGVPSSIKTQERTSRTSTSSGVKLAAASLSNVLTISTALPSAGTTETALGIRGI